ncbi:MAG TPA: inositol-3-phosphate synthase [Mycobacteriales bacterium]|nr:inositol-3-phosphate synthase [Mycobacteriales bacterium]
MAGRVGVWLIGARGSVATTAVFGAGALRAGLIPPVGCVGELPDIARAGLPGYADLVFGGHDVTDCPLEKRAEQLTDGGVLPHGVLPSLRADLQAAEAEIRPGYDGGAERSQRAAAAALAADLVDFRARSEVDRVVVVDVASTERRSEPHPATASLAALEAALDAGEPALPLSAVYAYAALSAGCPFVDFTPSVGVRLPALAELAEANRLPWAGNDGKTGETLVKAALAPMFASRALRVRSWAGTNLLGGGDGANLADPAAAASKLASKSRVLSTVLGHELVEPLHIDYVPDLGDWKTAWDHVSFSGFLGVRMSLQFTWQGCDSALAAPLVLDLARLIARAHEIGEVGPIGAFGYFFKDPVGTDEHRLEAQFDALRAWADRASRAEPAGAA